MFIAKKYCNNTLKLNLPTSLTDFHPSGITEKYLKKNVSKCNQAELVAKQLSLLWFKISCMLYCGSTPFTLKVINKTQEKKINKIKQQKTFTNISFTSFEFLAVAKHFIYIFFNNVFLSPYTNKKLFNSL
jgi:hypothetical protein